PAAGARRAAQALPPPALDLGHAHFRPWVGTLPRRRTPVDQPRGPAVPIACEPAVSLSLRQSRSAGCRPHRPALLDHPLHQQESTLRHQTRILVHVHPGDLLVSAGSVATGSLTGLARMNNLASSRGGLQLSPSLARSGLRTRCEAL